jgi:hypothetical protein
MEIITILCFVSSMTYVGWLLGIAQQIEASEKSITEAFKEGYIKGYFDGHANATKKEKPYFEDFPEMGIN